MPQLKHELIMTNGTIIQGTIIAENADAVIVQTQIGQLTKRKQWNRVKTRKRNATLLYVCMHACMHLV